MDFDNQYGIFVRSSVQGWECLELFHDNKTNKPRPAVFKDKEKAEIFCEIMQNSCPPGYIYSVRLLAGQKFNNIRSDNQ